MASDLILPPALALLGAGILLPVTRGKARMAVLLMAPLICLAMIWLVPMSTQVVVPFLDMQLVVVSGTRLGRMFATAFAAMAFVGGLFALNQTRGLELASAFIYAGAAIGVTFAGDLVTLFVFWEVMAVASTLLIWSNGAAARRAGMRYGVMHLLGGVILMAGIAGQAASTGSIVLGPIDLETWPGVLILIGFLINAAALPVAAWLPDAYPQASWSGMVFLSAFTTKTAVFVLIVGFSGAGALIWIGLAMVFYGIIYAILENDMRRILAYSIVNQVGFMVTGIGIGSEMALNGVAAHAFAHILYKALLVMAAGSVLLMTGKSKCSDLGGLFRTMPVTTICGIVGALSISAFPLTSGFVSKSLIAEGAAELHLAWVWYALTAASAGVFLHAGIKFPWFVFFQKDSGLRPSDPPVNMQMAMLVASLACIGIGVAPGLLYGLLPYATSYQPYTASHVIGQLQLLLFSGLAFFLMLGLLKRTLTITLDFDWLWRKPGSAVLLWSTRTGEAVWARLGRIGQSVVPLLLPKLTRGRETKTGVMAFWTTLMLAAFLLFGEL